VRLTAHDRTQAPRPRARHPALPIWEKKKAYCGCDDCCGPGVSHSLLMPFPIAERAIRLRSMNLTRFDHRPPVHEREWLPHLGDTLPSANDPAFIRAVDVEHDKPVTGQDVRRMRKVGRIRTAEGEHAAYMAAKEPGQKRGRQSQHFGGRLLKRLSKKQGNEQ
jgi:hypothetical protein